MKPKDFKALFKWDERRPLISDGVFYVPEYYQGHEKFPFPGWEDSSIFGNLHPVCIEFCTGNGDWIVEKAKSYPHINWVAVELRFDRVRKILSKKHNFSLTNLFIVSGEAWTMAHFYIPDNSVDGVYINFPDPWPKKRHEKHRLIKSKFIQELFRILKTGKEATFVTDDENYLSSAISMFQNEKGFFSRFSDPFFVRNIPNYGTSYFENLWREKGKNIYFTQFIKSKCCQ